MSSKNGEVLRKAKLQSLKVRLATRRRKERGVTDIAALGKISCMREMQQIKTIRMS